jgi:energy-coupling factor transporter transmembrane protein EcfT
MSPARPAEEADPRVKRRTERRVDRAERRAERQVHRVRELNPLRYVPGSSPLHRCWAGTKILAVVTCSIAILLEPTWPAAGALSALVVAGLVLARIPRGVLPRLPGWVWAFLAIGPALALFSGGAPVEHVASLAIGIGGLEKWALAMVIAFDVIAASALLAWTTQLADLAPALGRLLGPLRRIGLPVEDLIATVALSVRCLPLLLDEVRLLRAARRVRRPAVAPGIRERIDELIELLVASLTGAIRRAAELAEAIESRGGVPTVPPELHRLDRSDVWIALPTLGALAAMVVLH